MRIRRMLKALREECNKYDEDCNGCPLAKQNAHCSLWVSLDYNPTRPEEHEDIRYAYYLLEEKNGNSQEAKADAGKPRVSFVPMQIVYDIAVIREYGVNKYKTVDNWKNVEVERYVDALGRHTLAFLNNPLGIDEESGYPHLWHIECNAAFLSELMKGEWKRD